MSSPVSVGWIIFIHQECRYAPTDVCQAIYGGVSGAQYESSLGQWVVPCDAEIDMALQFE